MFAFRPYLVGAQGRKAGMRSNVLAFVFLVMPGTQHGQHLQGGNCSQLPSADCLYSPVLSI